MADNVINLEDVRKNSHDHLVRGTAADGLIRAFAITAKGTVEEARERHSTSPVATAALGRLLMAGQMMGAMSKDDTELLTLSVEGDGPLGTITVTANNRGQAKGFVTHPNVWIPQKSQGKLDVGGAVGQGTLRVVRDAPGARPYTSQVRLISGEIGEDLAYYFAASDQVPTSLGVGVLVDRDLSVRQAGGFLVQLMPGCDEATIERLEANLDKITSVTSMFEEGLTPSALLGRALDGLGYQELETMPAEFYCGCSKERSVRAVLALGNAELEDMAEKGEPAEVVCNFCGNHYRFEPEELRALINR